MTDMDEGDTRKKEGSAGRPAKLELKKPVEANQVRQNFPHGRSKLVTVEVRKKRTFSTDNRGRSGDGRGDRSSGGRGGDSGGRDSGAIGLTSQEKLARARALQDARRAEEERPAPLPPPPRTVAKEAPEPETPPVVETPVTEPTVKPAAVEAKAPDAPVETTVEQDVQPAETAATPTSAEEKPSKEADGVQAKATPETAELVTPVPETALATEGTLAATEPVAEDAKSATSAPAKTSAEPAKAGGAARKPATPAKKGGEAPRSLADAAAKLRGVEGEEDDGGARGRSRRPARSSGPKAPSGAGRRDDASARRGGRLSLSDALDEGGGERMRSLASVRRARQKEKMKLYQSDQEANKIVRDVTIPETITVQELANRMAERSTDVIKSLMRMGVMATINHAIDADTAELIATEFGHNVKRVSETDVELGLHGEEDNESDLKPRPPVVTVMGHVDHGKTSLLDALRRTDVAAHEAGGITQHIGAYQVTLASGAKITFIDTPGHEAFTQMRARGAKATDIVILVVAADDGVMPQTVEAIAHATAAGVPIIVAVNKIDRPDADPGRIRTNLLQHGIVVEEMGGETLCVDVSAKQGTNLDKLAEAILLQAEVLDLRANPDRPAEGVVIETKIERGRGPVATILVQRGTLRVGDIFVAGSEWGRVRGLMDANGAILTEAGPGMPVEILGLDGTPAAGDDVVVVNNEARAREVAEFRQRRQRDARTTMVRGSLEQFMSRIQEGEAKELSLVIKADVHGSGEAITTSLERLGTDEVKVRVLHSGVGGINESDVTLARASNALIIGFNVRANPQARELSKRDGVEIRYYSIIYDLIDDAKKLLTGMLAPKLRENLLGYAEIRQVFAISKVGKVAGCMVTEGMVKRGGKVRLLRDNVVIHEGELGQLKRFKDDVKEVKEGYDCGISLANYQDIQVGDMIECFEIEEIAQQL